MDISLLLASPEPSQIGTSHGATFPSSPTTPSHSYVSNSSTTEATPRELTTKNSSISSTQSFAKHKRDRHASHEMYGRTMSPANTTHCATSASHEEKLRFMSPFSLHNAPDSRAASGLKVRKKIPPIPNNMKIGNSRDEAQSTVGPPRLSSTRISSLVNPLPPSDTPTKGTPDITCKLFPNAQTTSLSINASTATFSTTNNALVTPEKISGKNQQIIDTTNPSKPFRCTVQGCDAAFGQKGSLTRHIRSRHEKLRPHTCDICLKSFSALWTLRVHQRNVHLKSKPHKCHLCDKSFGELFNKSKHIAIVHQRKRPFSCPICSRAFGYKGDMRKHVLELHQQSGRPFQCIIPSCGVKFSRKRYLRRHENLSHKGHPLLLERDRKEREIEEREENTDKDQPNVSRNRLNVNEMLSDRHH